MIIATFNANSIRSRVKFITDWLAANQPDVLCVQETKVQDEKFPVEIFEQSGYEFVFRGEKAYNGVAIFSRSGISDVVFGLDDEPHDEARMITAQVNGITVVNTYVPQGTAPDSEKFLYKLEWYMRLREHFNKNFSPDEPILWVGDLNVAMDERDVHNPKSAWGSVCYCQETINAMNNVIDWGFTDVFRMHNQEDGQFTFWDYRVKNGFKRNAGWRLDYIMATRPLAESCTRCWVDKEPRALDKPSDHTFLLAEFDL